MGRQATRVHLSCDYCVDFPIEMYVDGHLSYVPPTWLTLSAPLVRDLRDLQQRWGRLPDPDPPGPVADPVAVEAAWEAWDERRGHLLDRLRTELGPRYHVIVT